VEIKYDLRRNDKAGGSILAVDTTWLILEIEIQILVSDDAQLGVILHTRKDEWHP